MNNKSLLFKSTISFLIFVFLISCNSAKTSRDIFASLPSKTVHCEQITTYNKIEGCPYRVIASKLYTVFQFNFQNEFALAVMKNDSPDSVVYFQHFGRALGEVITGTNCSFLNDSILTVMDFSGFPKELMYYNLNDVYGGKTKKCYDFYDLSNCEFPSMTNTKVVNSLIVGEAFADSIYQIIVFNLNDHTVHKCMDISVYSKGNSCKYINEVYCGALLFNDAGTRFASFCQNADMSYFGTLSDNGACEVDQITIFDKPKYKVTNEDQSFEFKSDTYYGFGYAATDGEKIFATYLGITDEDIQRGRGPQNFLKANLIYVYDFEGNPLYSCVLDKDIERIFRIGDSIVGINNGNEEIEYYKLDM